MPNLTAAVWVKSSHSGPEGGQCVDFSRTFAANGVVPVRDSKTPRGPALVFPAGAWSAFVTTVKDGELTHRV
ncbi:DUF397 domain-containing protein [Streptomyces sp. B1866]|uniref:DUF397 domain-containing protein n=1 Tax=Streptomyces sp. B1866 TaxID=3075431 RepID=UPI002890B8EE|nr:DUF397 domain-containing protein [Streptomyces sp. B1866]MDT3400303.1 DUF397 domain-containing protein [Streptomyces sp. B1866]